MTDSGFVHCDADTVDSYLDDELDPRVRTGLEAHLRSCPSCAERVRGERLVREALAAPLRSEAAPAGLRSRVRVAMAATPLRRAGVPAVLRYALPLAAVLGALVLVRTLGPEGLPRAWARGIAEDHAEHHGASGTDFLVREGDPERLAAWFRGETGEDLVLPPNPAGAELVGGLLCLVNDRRVPHAVYRVDGRLVSYYVLPDLSPAGDRVAGSVEDLNYVAWSRDGGTAVVIGRAPSEELTPFTQS